MHSSNTADTRSEYRYPQGCEMKSFRLWRVRQGTATHRTGSGNFNVEEGAASSFQYALSLLRCLRPLQRLWRFDTHHPQRRYRPSGSTSIRSCNCTDLQDANPPRYSLELCDHTLYLYMGRNTSEYSTARWRAHQVALEENQVDVVDTASPRVSIDMGVQTVGCGEIHFGVFRRWAWKFLALLLHFVKEL